MSRLIWVSLGLTLLATPLAAQTEIPPELEALREPRIIERAAEHMLVVEGKGDPSVVGAQAFGLLFQLYYRMPATPKGAQQAAPRARWPVDFAQPRDQWIGLYALPVPDDVNKLPEHSPPSGMEAMLTTWDYGDVAEILHVGPYDQEEPTLQRLRDFVEEEGYVLAGDHEEEYIRGPTMSGPGDPDHYLTVLRYGVERQ